MAFDPFAVELMPEEAPMSPGASVAAAVQPATAQRCVSPAARAILCVEAENRRSGHENAGFLSYERGFIPRHPPRLRLSPAFAEWDELAAELPSLHRTLALRRRVDAMPVLDAGVRRLPDQDLLRACALLGLVAHAYWYVTPRPPARLPKCLSGPWFEIRRRLGRRGEVLSYVDLIVYNWRLREPGRADPLVVENLDLLIPTVGNCEERFFYLTQLEILARGSAIVALSAQAHDAILRDDPEGLEAKLRAICSCLQRIVRHSLPKIDPRHTSEHFVNPVVWAKTVAPLAVPFRAGVQGPSGTSSPLFNVLDVLVGRARHASFLGQEIVQLRGTYPPAWQAFLAALSRVSVVDYVERTGRPALRDALDGMRESYAGQGGFLGRHRMKVYGFLELAFKVGRSLTIGGFAGVFKDRTWEVVDRELCASQAERPQPDRAVGCVAAAPVAAQDIAASEACLGADAASGAAGPELAAIARSTVAEHNCDELGYWIVLDGVVYDVTTFLNTHPGGRHILRAYAGMDASEGFARAHARRPDVEALCGRYRLGAVRVPSFGARRARVEGRHGPVSIDAATLYRALTQALQLTVEMQNALRADWSLQAECLDGSCCDGPNPYKLSRALETHQRFGESYLRVLAEETLPELWELCRALLFPGAPSGLLREWLERVATAPRYRMAADRFRIATEDRLELWNEAPRMASVCRRLEAASSTCLAEIKDAFVAGVRALETDLAAQEACEAHPIRHQLLAAARAIERYHDSVAETLPAALRGATG